MKWIQKEKCQEVNADDTIEMFHLIYLNSVQVSKAISDLVRTVTPT